MKRSNHTAFVAIAILWLVAAVGITNENPAPLNIQEQDSFAFGGTTQSWAPIALADGKLLIRDHRRMKCVRVAQ